MWSIYAGRSDVSPPRCHKHKRLNGTTPNRTGEGCKGDSDVSSESSDSPSDNGPIFRGEDRKVDNDLSVVLRFSEEIVAGQEYSRNSDVSVPRDFKNRPLTPEEYSVYVMKPGSMATVSVYENMSGNQFSFGAHDNGSHGNRVKDATRYKETDDNEFVHLATASGGRAVIVQAMLFLHWFSDPRGYA